MSNEARGGYTTLDAPWRIGPALGRAAIVIAGILFAEFILIGPSLVGSKILLPLDYLALPEIYLPRTPETMRMVPHDVILSDLVLLSEPLRRFSADELHEGRWPNWNPYQFGGVPTMSSKFSPYYLLEFAIASPVVLAWIQVVVGIVAGLGAYRFCRRSLGVAVWPAIIAGWCYPLTGYFILWQGHGLAFAVSWLPWLLLAVESAVRNTNRLAVPAVAITTGLAIVSGNLDIAGQVLLTSGLFAVWCFIDHYLLPVIATAHTAVETPKRHRGPQPSRPLEPFLQIRWLAVLKAVFRVSIGWALGFMLAMPHVMPNVEFAKTGSRIEKRSAGNEERPPVGIAALPQVVMPDMYGTTRNNSIAIFPEHQGNQPESSAAAYTGLLATLFLAPLAWYSRRRLSMNLFLAFLAFFTLSWQLGVPGLVSLLRLPGLNMMSHNRFVFATSFAILAMMAIGLDVLWQGEIKRHWSFSIPIAITALILICSFIGIMVLPGVLEKYISQRQPPGQVVSPGRLDTIEWTWLRTYTFYTLMSALALTAWIILLGQVRTKLWLFPIVGVLLIIDLLWFGLDRNPQCDPALYYPTIPALNAIGKSEPGRIIGFRCLPAILSTFPRLPDVRGYDAVDPKSMVQLLDVAADPRSPKIPYALMEWMVPQILGISQTGQIRLHPVLDMLNVHYVIFRGTPAQVFGPKLPPGFQPAFQSPDYFVLTNPMAMPRVFVPSNVEVVADDKRRLEKLGDPAFNPRLIAYVEKPPGVTTGCQGEAKIVEEVPTRIKIAVDMATPGLVVLADRWDVGWKAYLDGQPAPILRTNHALRGVVVPAKKATLEFRYEPASFAWGLRLAMLALFVLSIWAVVVFLTSRGPSPAPQSGT